MSDWVLVDMHPSSVLSNKTNTLIEPVAVRKKRELEWLLEELHETLKDLKHGLEDCYALLAPIDPGSTLVVSTPRAEVVKGHITRVGTRIVKGVRRQSSLPRSQVNILVSNQYILRRQSTSVSERSPTRPSSSTRNIQFTSTP
jgi:hypothetical protein